MSSTGRRVVAGLTIMGLSVLLPSVAAADDWSAYNCKISAYTVDNPYSLDHTSTTSCADDNGSLFDATVRIEGSLQGAGGGYVLLNSHPNVRFEGTITVTGPGGSRSETASSAATGGVIRTSSGAEYPAFEGRRCADNVDGCTPYDIKTPGGVFGRPESPPRTTCVEQTVPQTVCGEDLIPDTGDPTALPGAPATPADDTYTGATGGEFDPVPGVTGVPEATSAFVWATDDPRTAQAINEGNESPFQALLSAQTASTRQSTFRFFICGVTFRRRVARVGATGVGYNYGARIGGPTINIPSIGLANPFASCSDSLFLAVQGRLVSSVALSLLSEAPRNPPSGEVLASNLFSGKAVIYAQHRSVRVRSDIRVGAPIGVDPKNFVVGVTYDPRSTDQKKNSCRVISETMRACTAYSDPYR